MHTYSKNFYTYHTSREFYVKHALMLRYMIDLLQSRMTIVEIIANSSLTKKGFKKLNDTSYGNATADVNCIV